MAILDSIKKFVFPVVDEDDEMEEVVSQPAPRAIKEETTNYAGVRKSKVVSLPTGSGKKIVIIKLDSNAGVKAILNHLKEKTPVIFNIARLDRAEAGRAVDIVYGASYALDGSMQKVSNDIFLATPQGMDIEGDITAEIIGSEEFSLDI